MADDGSAVVAVALGHIKAGRLAEAASVCRQILDVQPNHAQALHLLGAIALQTGDADGAIEHCRRAITADPSLGKAHSNLGAALVAAGRPDEAVAPLRTAIEVDPTLVSAHVNLGDALTRLERYDEAIAALQQALSLDPANLLAHINLSAALVMDERPDEAVAALNRTIERNPNLAEAHYNLGSALQRKDKHEQALVAFERARELKPAWADNCINFAMSYRALGRHEDAIAAYGEALALEPDLDDAAFFRALILLGSGRFEEGWKGYLRRPSARASKLPLHRAALAADLADERLFLRKDQGLGDELFFLRFAPELKRRGAHLTYQASDKIASLVRRLPFLDAVVGEDPVADTPCIISVGDLPFVLGMNSAGGIPLSLALPPLPDRLAAYRAGLAALGPPPYIGVTWRAGTEERGKLFKSCPLDRIGRVLRATRGTLVALQRLPGAGEIAALSESAGRPVHDLTAVNEDLEAMLALVSLLDEYVTVSNTNVHLRSATGKGSRVLVPWPPEFRWMVDGASPWFPECPVYRQARDGSWDAALASLASDLT